MYYYPTNMMDGVYNAPSYPSYPLGYGGYNGGYYGGGYYNTYNPYAVAQQQQIYKKQYEEELKNQRDTIATFYKASCVSGNNGDPKPEIIGKIYGRETKESDSGYIEGLTMEQNAEYRNLVERDRVIREQHSMLPYMIDTNVYPSQSQILKQNQLQQCNKIYKDRTNSVSEDIGLGEYFATQAVQDVLQAEDRNMKMEQSNLGELYNSNGYTKFLNQFRQSGPFAALNPNATIDDLSISLPSMVSEQQRAERRKAFLAQIGVM